VLRRTLGPKSEEVTEGSRRLHNEQLHNLYNSPNIIRVIKLSRMIWTRHVARMGEMRKAYSILLGKPEGKKPLGRPRRIWQCNIRKDHREIWWKVADRMHLAQDRDHWRALVKRVINLWFP
jgi:hypothetical protein